MSFTSDDRARVRAWLIDRARADDVLADWTRDFSTACGAVHLFDLPFLTSVYRVFLLPGTSRSTSRSRRNTNSARSFHTSSSSGAPRTSASVHRLRPRTISSVSPFHHAVRARVCIERARPWQVEHWLHELRKEAMTLACMKRGLETAHARGFDALPADVRDAFVPAIARSLDRDELLRALGVGIESLLRVADDARAANDVLGEPLRSLTR